MKITAINFTKTLQTDAYTWHKIGLQADMEESDTPQEAIKHLEKIVDGCFVDIVKPKEVQIRPLETPKMSPEEELIQAINNCTVLEGDEGLLTYRLPASLNPATKAAYDLKLALLKK